MVDLEARVDATVQAHADRQHGDGKRPIAAGIRGDDQTDGRTVLSDAVDDLARDRVREAVRVDHVVGDERDANGEDPHRHVGQC